MSLSCSRGHWTGGVRRDPPDGRRGPIGAARALRGRLPGTPRTIREAGQGASRGLDRRDRGTDCVKRSAESEKAGDGRGVEIGPWRLAVRVSVAFAGDRITVYGGVESLFVKLFSPQGLPTAWILSSFLPENARGR